MRTLKQWMMDRRDRKYRLAAVLNDIKNIYENQTRVWDRQSELERAFREPRSVTLVLSEPVTVIMRNRQGEKPKQKRKPQARNVEAQPSNVASLFPNGSDGATD